MDSKTFRRTAPDQLQDGQGSGSPGEPREAVGIKPLVPGMRRLLVTAAVLVLLAGFQLFVLTGRTGTFFAWTITNPLAAAFLGAGYWASVSIEALSGRQRLWANARIAVPAVFVFTVLTLVATLMHLGQFHLGARYATGTRIVTVGWFAIYVLVPLLMLVVLAVQAIVLLGLGVALFTVPTQAAPLWPWKLTPLVAQATGAWLISLGVAAVHALLERDARRLRPAAVGYVLLALLQSIALARYPNYFAWHSASGMIYLIFLAAMLLTGVVWLARGLSRPESTGDYPADRPSADETEDSRRVTAGTHGT